MPFPSPAIITQDKVDCRTMTSSNESFRANSVDNILMLVLEAQEPFLILCSCESVHGTSSFHIHPFVCVYT